MASQNLTSSYTSLSSKLLWPLSIVFVLLLYLAHGFQIYSGDTIETIPYALWMQNPSLFSQDFHLSHLIHTFPNERYFISLLLSWFPSQMAWASHIFHALFSVSLCAGMLSVAHYYLKNIEWSASAVFFTLFSLYFINMGNNELYYNMFIPSLAAKGVAIWAVYFSIQQRWLIAMSFLAMATFLQPLVGFQLFILTIPLVFLWQWRNGVSKEFKYSIALYLFSGGIWVALIAYHQFSSGGSSPNMESLGTFSEIVRFRIAHHFYPAFFPKSHILVLSVMYVLCLVHFWKHKNPWMKWFFLLSFSGILIYCIGLSFKIDLVLASQWMKINIWLKFFAVIGILGGIQQFIESKYWRLVNLGLFTLALMVALFRLDPSYDKAYPGDMYSWIQINTDEKALFLVPPHLTSFKAHTLRSSYFDFKAMVHHKPGIFEWANRMYAIFGLKPKDRKVEEDFFRKVRLSYLEGEAWDDIRIIDYYIVPSELLEKDEIKNKLIDKTLVFTSENYNLYRNDEAK